jgi:SNF2 family DNA or RNA helicase
MSSSPIRDQQSTTTTVVRGSPPRYHNRYSERYKALLTESPPREQNSSVLKTPERNTPTTTSTTTTSNLKNSPLQPNRTSEHKIFEGEKYTSFEIKNEDRGEWRETMLKETIVDEEVVEISRPKSPVSPPQPRRPSAAQKVVIKKERAQSTISRGSVPHYMQATSAFEQRVHSTMEQHRNNHSNLLRPRTKGGITVS